MLALTYGEMIEMANAIGIRVGDTAKRFAASSLNHTPGVMPCHGRGVRIGSVVRFSLLIGATTAGRCIGGVAATAAAFSGD